MPATRKLTSFLDASPAAKRQKKNASEDADLQKAIELSEREARLASMSEEAQLQEAFKESLGGGVEQQDADTKVSQSEEKERKKPQPKADGIIVPTAEPILNDDAFDYRSEVTIDRLNASLDLIYVKDWLRKKQRLELRDWMLTNLAWHRVTYIQPRYKVRIVTPRFTATFGKDDTGAPDSKYLMKPKPFPPLLDHIRRTLEKRANAQFNAIIINYYADGQDSISYHSDDEAFLGTNPTIASISLGASRDFYLRRKAPASKDVPAPTAEEKMGTKGKGKAADRPIEKMQLHDGDLLIMRGRTQAEWEHSIPKRAGNIGGRINMTFRRVINVSGTNNFIKYNRMGDGAAPEYRWNAQTKQMTPMQGGI